MLSRALIHLPACSTIAWLYVYDCISMIVCVWLYDKRRPMLSWRSQDYIQLVTVCNPQWLRMYEFMLVACRRSINIFVNSGTELWTQKCATRTPAYVFALRYMGMRRTPMCNVIAWLYVYDFICMILCVWLYDNVRMMSWWWKHGHIQLVTACHPTWLRLYQFMLVDIPGEVPEGCDPDAFLGSGGFRCRYLLQFWRVPVQIPGQLLEGSCADTCWGSWPWFLYHCAAPLHDCMCMIVWQCAHEATVKITWLLEVATAYNPTWLLGKNETKHKLSSCWG